MIGTRQLAIGVYRLEGQVGSLLTSILQGAGRAGGDAREAQLSLQDEKRKQQDQALKMQEFQAQMRELAQRLQMSQFTQQRESAPQFQGRVGKYNVFRNPMDGKLSYELAPVAEPVTYTDQRLDAQGNLWGVNSETKKEERIPGGFQGKSEQTEVEKKQADWTVAQQIGKQMFPDDPKKAMEAARSLMPGGAAVNKVIFPGMVKPTGSGASEKMIKAMADKWTNEGVKPPSKYQAEVEEYMEDRGQKGKIKLTNQEQSVADGIKMVEPMIDRLIDFIEKNKLTDEGSWAFGDHSALMQHLRFYGYKKGVKPEDVSAELIKDAAAIQVQGAKPLMTMGRSKYMYETIVQHLPTPTDTPQLLYDKVAWLRDNVIENAKASLPEGWEGKGQTAGGDQKSAPPQSTNNDPLGIR
jgi:hypothetical protein